MSVVALPDALSRAIAAEGVRLPRDALIHAAQSLSSSYRRKADVLPARLNDAARTAYLAMRLPATFAAISAALREMSRTVDTARFEQCLDVGAGPGTASFAARATIQSLTSYAQIERDGGWSDLAQRLAQATGQQVSRTLGDVGNMPATAYDLVIAGYLLNEQPEPRLDAAIRALWSVTAKALIVVEPGTPQGFGIVRRARELCLGLGAHAVAPCTHNGVCPMTPDDWCHRAVRVERSALHRALKLADLSFEDEKFSYVVLTREPPQDLATARIVRRPIRAGGHVHLDLCSQAGLTRTTVGRADRAAYKAARAAEWGDIWPP